MMDEVYFSTDIEADGPIPGPNSMLSFASVAFAADGAQLGQFTANLELLPGASADPRTAEFWARNQEAYQSTRTGVRAPAVVMPEYVAWVVSIPGKPVFVAYPAGFDFMFVYWYLMRFAGSSPFSHSALDMKTMAMALMNTTYRSSTKSNMPRAWFPADRAHTHVAIDDAIEQGLLFCAMLRELRSCGRRRS